MCSRASIWKKWPTVTGCTWHGCCATNAATCSLKPCWCCVPRPVPSIWAWTRGMSPPKRTTASLKPATPTGARLRRPRACLTKNLRFDMDTPLSRCAPSPRSRFAALPGQGDGALHAAAASLRYHPLLSRSKGGSDMLKRLIALPEHSNFALAGHAGAETPQLAQWSLRSHADYRTELARRSQIAQAMDAALWLAGHYELEQDALEEAGADAEAVIRAGLLWQALAPQAHEWPHAVALEKRLTALRKKKPAASATVVLPPGLPDDLRDAMQAHCASVQADVARLLDGATALRTLLRPTGAFRARYFLQDDPLAEVDDYLRRQDDHEEGAPPQPASKTWARRS